MHAPRSFWSTAGFSTHEILVAMAVGLLISAGFVSFNHFQIRAMHDQMSQIQLQEMDRSVIDLFGREVRRAGTNPTCAAGITALSEASDTQFRIQADLDGDGVLDAINEDITYRYNFSNEHFERVTGGVAETLFSNVNPDGSGIWYYDGSGVKLVPNPTLTAAEAASVRRIRFQLRLSKAGFNTSDTSYLSAAAATDINLRNRFFIGAVNCTP